MHIFNSRIIVELNIQPKATGDTMSDSSLLILFGSESGNAEDLASIAEKQAKSQGLSPTVRGLSLIHI